MITEDYVSFETAKLLKEKGFDEQLCHFYTEEGLPVVYKTEEGVIWANNSKSEHAITQPTQQMAMKWLREVHYLHIETPHVWLPFGYKYSIIRLDKDYFHEIHRKDVYESCEDACEAAIQYCLKNLI